ncbi:putative Diaminopropionate ammonia-lyase [Seiridium cardinale]|uniref:Diaminopropionate ammonia-lyase n=1 Tax=Seiridium cardinale TaxID=138064 RepID=A0ABR2XYN4_9PEZI
MSTMRRPPFVRENYNTQGLAPFDSSAVSAFHRLLPGYRSTPLVELPDIARELGLKGVFIKDESDRFGLPSFKILGASWGAFTAIAAKLGVSTGCTIDRLAAEARKAGVVLFAATDGNHGRAVAYMAKLLSVEARIFVSRSLDEHTRRKISAEGADVVVGPGDYDDAVRSAAEAADAFTGGVLVQDTSFPGYEETPAKIVEGYSTIFREVDDQLEELGLSSDVVFSPVGVGSLAHSVLRHHKSRSRQSATKVVAVEPDTAACLYKSLQANSCGPKIRTSHTIMTGLDCGTVSYTAWPDLQLHIDASVTISDFEAHCAVQELGARGLESGPCGASGLAALRYLTTAYRKKLGLDENAVVVLLNTEGERPYDIPHDVSIDDPVELTQILTRLESTNPTVSSSSGSGEGDIADYIEAWLQHRNIDRHRHELTAGRPSIHCILQPRSVRWAPDGEQWSGRGHWQRQLGYESRISSCDDISLICKESSLAGKVLLAALADEEDSSCGTSEILAAGWRADGAVVTEPTMLQLGTGHRGFMWFEGEILRVAAHGSRPDIGVDAILNAGLFLNSFRDYATQLPGDSFLGQASAHCGLIEGGEELSSYPASCKVKIEFRTVPGQESKVIQAGLITMLETLRSQNPDFKYQEPELLLERAAFRLLPDHPFFEAAKSAAEETLKQIAIPVDLGFWCDAALLNRADIPAVIFGPAGEGLHGKEEWVEASSFRKTTRMLDLLITNFCK